MDAEMNLEQVAVEALPAIEDSSPVSHRSSIGDNEEQALTALKQQLESAHFVQQMFHQSEIQKYKGIVQTLVAKINEMKQEDEGSEIRVQELERQLVTACLAMRHMNQVNQGMKNDYEAATMRMSEISQAQRQRDHGLAEELAQQLRRLRSEAATSFVQLEEKAQGDDMVMAREYERLTAELHEQARENLHLRSGMATTEQVLTSMRNRHPE